MPKVNSYAPAWLCRPSPGASLFTSASVKSPAQDLQSGKNNSSANGPTRTIAKRGHEVFAVVDNEIRWSNLARLKDQWEQQSKQKKTNAGQAKETADGSNIPSYRVIIYRLIRASLDHTYRPPLTLRRF
jgi:nucleoporin NUP82